MTIVYWLLFLKCEDKLPFSVLYSFKLSMFWGFWGLTVGERK